MKVISYNVRGLGGGEKRVEVRRFVQENNPFVLCIQESKLSIVDEFLVKSIWGISPCGFSFQPSVGASGGLLTVWDSSLIDVWSSMSFAHVLIITGRVILIGETIVIINVYAPCEPVAKKELCERLVPVIISKNDSCLCVCGDFNSIRSRDERKGRGMVFKQVEADIFIKFIDDSLLIDFPLCVRLYTWYRGDGVSMSRLDHFLLSDNWCEAWPNCFQVAYQRGLSDHVPLMLHVDDANWGPRPLRMLKCWSEYPGYSNFVREQWGSFQVQRWGSYVLRQKFKMIHKNSLKEWHRQHSQNMEGKMTEVKNRVSYLVSKGEVSALCDEEVMELHELSANLHSMARIHNSINWQKARLKWLQEGDANSKFFHGVMSYRRRRNAINLVNVEGVQNIRRAVFELFF